MPAKANLGKDREASIRLASPLISATVGDRIVSPIRKTDTQARDIEATSVDFPIHPDVRRAIAESRRSKPSHGKVPVHHSSAAGTHHEENLRGSGGGKARASRTGAARVCVQGFSRARLVAAEGTSLFVGLAARELPTLHEIRALSSHLYAKAGYEVVAVQDLMAHTDPDMTRAYQKGHARKVEMMLPWSVQADQEDSVGEPRARYSVRHAAA